MAAATPIDPFFTGVAAAGISSAFDLAGGFLSRPDQSQRDLMWEGQKIWERQAERRYPLQVKSLRRAGLNPILAVSQPAPSPSAPSAPQPYTDPLGAAVGKAGSSALSAFMAAQTVEQVRADTKMKKAQADQAASQAALLRAQAITEAKRPGLVQQQTLETGSAYMLNRQKIATEIMETEIRRANISKAQRDAAIAALQYGLLQRGVDQFNQIVEWLNLPKDLVGELRKQSQKLGGAIEQFDKDQGGNSAFYQWMMKWRGRVFGEGEQ